MARDLGDKPWCHGNGFTLAETGGVETVTLTVNQMAAHTHPLLATATPGTNAAPSNSVFAKTTTGFLYINENTTGNMAATAIGSVGGNQPHNNFQPYLCIDFIISLFGLFPSPT